MKLGCIALAPIAPWARRGGDVYIGFGTVVLVLAVVVIMFLIMRRRRT